jgi:lipopolysaccharide export system permease protein
MSVCELQQEVARSEQEYEAARAELSAARRALQTERKTGLQQFVMPPPAPPLGRAAVSKRLTLGRLYCDALRRVGGSALVLSRWVLPNEVSAQQQGQDTARSAAPNRGIGIFQPPEKRDSAVTAAPVPPGPVVAPVVPPSAGTGAIPAQAAMESARLRTEQFRQAIFQNEVEIHKKFAISIACIVFVLVGAPIAVRFPRGGVGLVIGFSLVIFAIYYIGLIAGESLADRGIMTPFWAMWAANIILTLVGLLLLWRMGRETATTRGGDIADLLDTLRGVLRLRRRHEVETA